MAQRARLVTMVQSAGLAALLLLAGLGTADACTCIKEGTACGGLDTAEVVFEATVETITRSERSAGSFVFAMNRVAFSSIRRFRGQATDFVLTATEESACGFVFSRGERYVVFAERTADGSIIVSRCGLTRLAAGAEPLIAAVQQAFTDRSSVVFGTLKGETATTRMAPVRVQHADGQPAIRLRVTLSAVGVHDSRAWEPRRDASAVSDDSGTVTLEVWQSVPYLVRVGSVEKPLAMRRLDGTAVSIAIVVP